MMINTFDEHEVNALIQILQAQGISYLLGSDQPLSESETTIDPVLLIQRLVSCGFPLVEHACISLFILHPELAPAVLAALQKSELETAENIAVVTLATLYMQEWWFFRLAFAFGQLPSFPEVPFQFLWEERNLPPPSSGYGREGFLALQGYEQERYGAPLNFLHDWQNQINHLLAQEETYQRQMSDEIVKELRQYAA